MLGFEGMSVVVESRRSFEERERLRRIALRGLTDLWFLGSVILKLGMEEGKPRPREEIEPMYRFVEKPWPQDLNPEAKWLRALCVPRFLAKTYIILVWILQQILKDPNITIAYHCCEKDQAIEGVRLIREWLESPIIVHLYGNHKSRNWNPETGLISALRRKGSEKNPTLRPLGMDKPLEGKRVHIFVWDDLIGETNYKPEGVIKVEKRRSACMPLLRGGGIGWWLCTRWGVMDPMSDGQTFGGEDGILKKWKRGEWDCFGTRGFVGAYAVPGDEKIFPHIKENPKKTSTGKVLVFPSVWNERSIEEARKEMAFGLHASQVLNDPLPDESRHFRKSDFKHFELFSDEEPSDDGSVPFNPILRGTWNVLALDPNKSADQLVGSDRHALIVMALKNIRDVEKEIELWFAYILHWEAGRWSTSDLIDKYFELVKIFKPRRHFIETNVGGAWITSPIRKRGRELGYFTLPIEEIKTSKVMKDDRLLQTLQPAYAYGHIYHAEHLKGGEGEQELLRWMPNSGAHDDLVDVEEIAYSHGTMKKFSGIHAAGPAGGARKFVVARTWRTRYRRAGV